MKKFLLAIIASASFAGSGAVAATLHGEFWDVAPNTIASVTQAINAVNGGADPTTATFTSTGINYGDAGANWAIGSLSDFLNADAGSINGTDPANIQESVFRLTGSVSLTTGDNINVTSDDGFRLTIGGVVLNAPGDEGLRGPGSSTNMTWTGATGVYATELWFFEGNVTQVQLISNLNDYSVAAVPVPASALLLLTGLGGIVAMRRRRKSA